MSKIKEIRFPKRQQTLESESERLFLCPWEASLCGRWEDQLYCNLDAQRAERSDNYKICSPSLFRPPFDFRSPLDFPSSSSRTSVSSSSSGTMIIYILDIACQYIHIYSFFICLITLLSFFITKRVWSKDMLFLISLKMKGRMQERRPN